MKIYVVLVTLGYVLGALAVTYLPLKPVIGFLAFLILIILTTSIKDMPNDQ